LRVFASYTASRMQVSSWVKEAIDEAALYAALDHQPDVAAYQRKSTPERADRGEGILAFRI
jgi:hypothetical protein